jgi:hypothetical protein
LIRCTAAENFAGFVKENPGKKVHFAAWLVLTSAGTRDRIALFQAGRSGMVDEPLPCILNAGREAVTLPKEGDLGGDVGISDFGFRMF